jgi:hypothetical protein
MGVSRRGQRRRVLDGVFRVARFEAAVARKVVKNQRSVIAGLAGPGKSSSGGKILLDSE